MQHQDDIQEKAWVRRLGRGADWLETKRRVAGSALHVDVALHGRLTFPPLDRFLPNGTVAVENKTPGTYLRLVELVGFNGRVALLIERGLQEGTPWRADEAISGLIVTSRLAREAEQAVPFAAQPPYAGVRSLSGPLFGLYVWEVDRIEAVPEHLPWILLFASDRRLREVLSEVDLELPAPFLLHAYFSRRELVRRIFAERGIDMATVTIDIRGAIEDLGIRRVVEEVGLERVLEEIGPERVVDTLGVDRIQEIVDRIRRQGKSDTVVS